MGTACQGTHTTGMYLPVALPTGSLAQARSPGGSRLPRPNPLRGRQRAPLLQGRRVLVLDPMLATGGQRGRAQCPQLFAQLSRSGASSDLNALLEADWDTAAEPLAALGHPVRLAVLRGVLTGLHTTAELAALDRLGTTGQLYHHLRQLQAAGWLRSTGRRRYDVPATRVIPLLVILTAAQP